MRLWPLAEPMPLTLPRLVLLLVVACWGAMGSPAHSEAPLPEIIVAGPVEAADTHSGGFATTSGGNIPGAWRRSAATLEDMIQEVAAAKAAGKPLVLIYTGNEDAQIARIIQDHTADAYQNCPPPALARPLPRAANQRLFARADDSGGQWLIGQLWDHPDPQRQRGGYAT